MVLGLPCWKSKIRKPFASESKGFVFWVEFVAPSLPSVGYLSCVVCMFVSYSIGVEVLPCVHPKGSGSGFPLSSKNNLFSHYPFTRLKEIEHYFQYNTRHWISFWFILLLKGQKISSKSPQIQLIQYPWQ